MDDVSESIAVAWREAVKGMKTGYKKTKSALKQTIPTMVKTGAGGVMTHGDIRRFFQMKYGANVGGGGGGGGGGGNDGNDGSDVDTSSDEEPLTDEQIHERVDKKYFDRSYDPVKFEITHMEATYTDDEEESKRERAAAEEKILELRAKCTIVSATLKKRVLANHQSFVTGIEQVRRMNDSLFQTSSDCKKASGALRKSRQRVAGQLTLLAQHRTRDNARAALALMQAMQTMTAKRNQLLALIASGNLVEASDLLKRAGAIAHEEQLSRVHSMKAVMGDWRRYRDSPRELGACIAAVLTECFSSKFILMTYRNAFESAPAFGLGSQTCDLVPSLLWQTAVQIIQRSLLEVSYVKSETASLADLADGVHPDHLMLCLSQMAAKLMDFLFLFVVVRRVHEEGSRAGGSSVAPLHAEALSKVQAVGQRIARDLIEKLAVVLSGARLALVDIDRVLHIFVVISMLVEAISAIGLDRDAKASARTLVKTVLQRHMMAQFQVPKAKELLSFMADDSWGVSDVSAFSLNIVRPLSPEVYRRAIKEVKRYLNLDGGGGGGGGADGAGDSTTNTLINNASFAGSLTENPFYSTDLLMPQDLSDLVRTEAFGQYWSAAKDAAAAAASAAATSPTAAASNSAEATAAAAAPPTLVSAAAMPPSLLTSSAITVANTFLEYEARVAVRFPPLAADILYWCDDLLSLYLYTVADNFVSISRTVLVEHQSEMSAATAQVLEEAHAAADRAVQVVNGSYRPYSRMMGEGAQLQKFPPRVWGRIREQFASAAAQYAVGNRAVACESVVTLVFLYEASVKCIAPLLPDSIVAERLARCRSLYTAATELLHVGIHRLCQAILPLESVCAAIGKLKPKDEVKVSAYVGEAIAAMRAALESRGGQTMPTPALETLFLQRFIFSVQTTLLREYAKLAKKRMSDLFVMQVQVDVQNFQQQAASAFGRENVVLPNHVLGLVKTGFYLDDKAQRLSWLRENHARYYAADLVLWMSAGDKVFKTYLEELLAGELRHRDAIPIDNFLQQV